MNTYTTQVAVLPPNTGLIDGWKLETTTFKAPANAATTPWLTFKSYQSDPNGNGTYMGIDDVRLVATPEPSSVVLLSLAAVGLGLRHARSKRTRFTRTATPTRMRDRRDCVSD